MSEKTKGWLYAFSACTIWGASPAYWKLFDGVLPTEVFAHRTLWSMVFVAAILILSGRISTALALLRNPKQLLLLALSACLISANWGIYIWAVSIDEIVQSSLGYFLSPLFSICFGLLFFAERLRPWQWLSIAIATAGVLYQVLSIGQVPWLGLSVALTFAGYGAVRKKSQCDALGGVLGETLLIAPLALGYMLWLESQQLASFWHGPATTDALLILAGVASSTPLLLFVAGARRLPLTTLGLLFYINPLIQFALGYGVYNEPVSNSEWVTFALTWIALLLYVYDDYRRRTI